MDCSFFTEASSFANQKLVRLFGVTPHVRTETFPSTTDYNPASLISGWRSEPPDSRS